MERKEQLRKGERGERREERREMREEMYKGRRFRKVGK